MNELENLKIQGLEICLQRLEIMMSELIRNQKHLATYTEQTEIPEWVNLRKAVELKGCGEYSTYKCNSDRQPLCGIAEGKVCGLKAWRRETIVEWLQITDDQINEYKKQVYERLGNKKVV